MYKLCKVKKDSSSKIVTRNSMMMSLETFQQPSPFICWASAFSIHFYSVLKFCRNKIKFSNNNFRLWNCMENIKISTWSYLGFSNQSFIIKQMCLKMIKTLHLFNDVLSLPQVPCFKLWSMVNFMWLTDEHVMAKDKTNYCRHGMIMFCHQAKIVDNFCIFYLCLFRNSDVEFHCFSS